MRVRFPLRGAAYLCGTGGFALLFSLLTSAPQPAFAQFTPSPTTAEACAIAACGVACSSTCTNSGAICAGGCANRALDPFSSCTNLGCGCLVSTAYSPGTCYCY